MRIVFLGTGDVGLPTLDWLIGNHELVAVVAQPDKPVGRKQELTPPPTKKWALEHGVPVLQPGRIRNPEAVAEIAALQPEVIVVMAYGQILPKVLLDLPPKGCLNLHASILPRFRGAAPIQAAIEAGDRETGVTVMWMDVGLDTGDILLIESLPIRRRETGGSLHDRLASLAAVALAKALPEVESGAAGRTSQLNAAASYAPKLSRESGVIDWRASCGEIDRRVRAMNPWPAASTLLLGEGGNPSRLLKVFSVIQHRRYSASSTGVLPGTVVWADKRGIMVAAGKGGVLLRDIQLEGKRRMPVRDLLLGNPIPPGTRLGV